MTESKNAVGDAEQWLIAEYEALSENIRQRERFLESTTYYAFTALGTAATFLLYFTPRSLAGWQPSISFLLASVFLIFSLDIIRQQFEIVWLATVIDRCIHSTIAPFYGGKRLLHWEPFRLAKRLEVLGEKKIFSIIVSSIIPKRVTARRIIELKPACILVLLLSLAFSAFGCWSWWHGDMCPSQHVLAALLGVAYAYGVMLLFRAGGVLLEQSKLTAKRAEPMEVLLRPGDVFFTRGSGLLSRAIRICTRSIGEKRSKVNHVGVVVEEGGIQTAVVVEALSKVRKHRLWKKYGPPKKVHVAVYRAKNLKPEEIEIIVAEANEQVGRLYRYGKIIAHLLDWLLTGVYFFRRLTSDPRYPICSWLVAHSYSKAGKYFGVAPGAADPDDIWDFVDKRTDIYEPIIELGSLTRFAPSVKSEDSIP